MEKVHHLDSYRPCSLRPPQLLPFSPGTGQLRAPGRDDELPVAVFADELRVVGEAEHGVAQRRVSRRAGDVEVLMPRLVQHQLHRHAMRVCSEDMCIGLLSFLPSGPVFAPSHESHICAKEGTNCQTYMHLDQLLCKVMLRV